METILDRVSIERITLCDADKREIEQLYTKLLGKPFIKRASCNDCYRDAIIEIKIYLKHSQMKYSLKKGALVFDHASNNYYTDANITDQAAQSILDADRSMISQFASFPADWENPKASKPAPNDPTGGKPKTKKPTAGKPKTVNPKVEKPKVDDSGAENPTDENPDNE